MPALPADFPAALRDEYPFTPQAFRIWQAFMEKPHIGCWGVPFM